MIDLDKIEKQAADALESWSLVELREVVQLDVPALIARVRELEALLREGAWDVVNEHCPWCHEWFGDGHAPDCPWQAAMGEK